MKNYLNLFLFVSFLSIISLNLSAAENSSTLLNSIRSTCTVAGGEWDTKTMTCFKGVKADTAGVLCGRQNLGVTMFTPDHKRYCCQAYDVTKSGEQYLVKCEIY